MKFVTKALIRDNEERDEMGLGREIAESV